MKKIVIILALSLGLTHLHAQTEQEKNTLNDYNKWSVELAGGFNKPSRTFTSSRYYSSRVSPFTADLGVRYMMNNKFGLKADFGYNSLTEQKNSSLDFTSKYYRVDLQGVANLGRIMNFETWTKTIGLLGHAGFGVAQLENSDFHFKDRMGNLIAGLTGQIRLTDRIALTGDVTTIFNTCQDANFDGAGLTHNRGFSGVVFNGTVGLNVYLGKNAKHNSSVLEAKIADLENLVKKMPEKQVIVEKPVTTTIVNEKDLIKEMIDAKYYSVYFDFNKATPIENSTAAIDVVLTYLRKNPSANLDILGYADQVGSSEYNEKLSNLRANNVKTILEKAGIASSRLNVVAQGADTSIQKDSEEARRLARRVTFKIR